MKIAGDENCGKVYQHLNFRQMSCCLRLGNHLIYVTYFVHAVYEKKNRKKKEKKKEKKKKNKSLKRLNDRNICVVGGKLNLCNS